MVTPHNIDQRHRHDELMSTIAQAATILYSRCPLSPLSANAGQENLFRPAGKTPNNMHTQLQSYQSIALSIQEGVSKP